MICEAMGAYLRWAAFISVLITDHGIYIVIAKTIASEEERRNGVPSRVDPITTCGCMVVNASPRN